MKLKVFVSWSGERSRSVAEALRGWIPNVVQNLEPWMSDQDLAAGSVWSEALKAELVDTRCGIICLTAENLNQPWLHFEAGALAKAAAESCVVPYRFGVSESDILGPMALLQGVDADQAGTLKLMESINRLLESPLQNLPEIFDVWWPRLEQKLISVSTSVDSTRTRRATSDVLDELLAGVRELVRKSEPSLSSQPPTTYFRPADELRKGDWRHVWTAIDKRFGPIEEMDAATLEQFIKEVSSFDLFYIGWNTPHDFDDYVFSNLEKARARLSELSSEQQYE